MGKRNIWTSISGALMMALGVIRVYDTGDVSDDSIVMLVAGVGLLKARDGKMVKPEETKPEETKPEETKPEETKPEETKPEAAKLD